VEFLKKLVYDQGPEFAGKVFKKFCCQYNIQLHVISFQQSSSNSPVERLHSTLTEIYRIITDSRKEEQLPCEHEEVLSQTMITYNNAINSSIKLTPYEVFHGKTHTFNNSVKFNGEHDYFS